MKTDDILIEIIKAGLLQKTGTLHTDNVSRQLYATDASVFKINPIAVYLPQNEDDVLAAIRIAKELGLGIHTRGGATGLAGESLGEGIVLDMHESFQQIEINAENKSVVAGCGVVLDELNSKLKKHHLMFGPDPSSANRCTIGGIIANNATGTHSLKYGYTSDHVLSIRMATSDGKILHLKPGPADKQPERFRKLIPILEKWQDTIETAYPEQDRNRCGYNLRGVWDGKIFNPIPLVCGSEATFGVILSAELSLVEIPAVKTLLMFIFEDNLKACKSVSNILPFKPAGLELITDHVIQMGRKHDPRLNSILPPSAKAVLLGEWSGDTLEEVKRQINPVLSEMRSANSTAIEVREAYDKNSMDLLWLIRKEAEALILNCPGKKKAISFVEDTAINPVRLGQWLSLKDDILKKHGFSWATFGHAGSGELHSKVFINVQDKKEYQRLVEMSDSLYEKLIALGGSISGEHGDGLSRTPYINKQYPELYPAFKEIKDILDPDGILNPGKKVFEYKKHPVLEHSRLADFKAKTTSSHSLHYEAANFEEECIACHGCAACRSKSSATSMCPFFRILDTEYASPRAKGNLARLHLEGAFVDQEISSDIFAKALESCFNCKMCLTECPSHVDIPHLVLELKHQTKISGFNKATENALANLDKNLEKASSLSFITNSMMKSGLGRWVGKKIFGLDQDVKLQTFSKGNFAKKAEQIKQIKSDNKVVYYADYHVLYQNHQLGLRFIKFLNKLGYEVIPFTVGGCGLVAMDMGDFDSARKTIDQQKHKLFEHTEQGYQIVTTEPSATLMIAKEWPCLKDDEQVRKVAESVVDSTEFLGQIFDYRKDIVFKSRNKKMAYHAPCHLKALQLPYTSLDLLSGIPQLEVIDLDSGCCGMAGVWGMFAKNRRLSENMASELYHKLNTDDFDLALSECSTCRLQMENSGADLPILHPLEILMDAIDL